MEKQTPTDNLITALLALKNSNEAQRFLIDLMTKKEIDEFSKRFKAAQMLVDKIPYTKIVNETGLSSTTIARVSRFLQSDTSGYRTIIERLHHHTSSQSRKGLS